MTQLTELSLIGIGRECGVDHTGRAGWGVLKKWSQGGGAGTGRGGGGGRRGGRGEKGDGRG
eukprot:2110578-Rhodomonas_salina.1